MDAKLNHSDLSALLAKETAMSVAKTEQLTKAMFDLIIEGLEQDGIVKINGLGTFKVADVASRNSVNVNTGEKIEIKGHKKLTFTPADSLRDNVNQPFAMFEPVEVDEKYCDEEIVPENDEAATEEGVQQATVETDAENTTMDEGVEAEDTAISNDTEETAVAIEETETTAVDVTAGEAAVEPEEESVDTVYEECAAVDAEDADTAVKESAEETPVSDAGSEENKEIEIPVQETVTGQDVKVTAPKKRKRHGYKFVFYFTLLIIFGIAAFYCGYYLDIIAKDDTSAVAQMAPAENVVNTPVADGYIPVEEDEELMEADAVTGATVDATSGATVDATTGATPQDVGIIEEDETGALPEKKEYKFVVTDELAAMDLKEITVADTLLYVADGNYTEHTVKADETLTRIALKYYGDKKMWPYIVKHNSLARPDDLCKGMVLVIPRLEPRK